MSDLSGRFPGWLVLIWGRPCVRRCVVRPADVCCGVAGRRDASGAFASCRSINSRPLFSSFSDHLPASPPALLCPFAGPSPNFSRVFSALLQLPSSPRPVPVQSPSSPRPVPVQSPSSPRPGPLESLSRPFPGPFQALSRPFSGPSRTLRNPPPTPQDTKKEVAPSVQPPLPEPNPRLDFASLVFSLLLAAGALSKVRLAARASIRHEKTACKLLCGGFSLTSRVLRPWTFEPNPRLELGTPSLRVKCSTTELIRPARTLA